MYEQIIKKTRLKGEIVLVISNIKVIIQKMIYMIKQDYFRLTTKELALQISTNWITKKTIYNRIIKYKS